MDKKGIDSRVIYGIMILALLVFLGAGGYVLYTMLQYGEEIRVYKEAAEEYVQPEETAEPERERNCAPIRVDFEDLQARCGDVVGWIYCEDTVINYPVVQGEDNDYYLNHDFEGRPSGFGAIFVDANNQRGFADSNTIVYGHHMKNGSMFASLDKWADQEYYDNHSFMWLLTPEQDYKIILYSSYNTSAYSDTYKIFTGPSEDLNEYLRNCYYQSEFQSQAVLYSNLKYILLSTCSYVYDDARRVLHGVLVPVESAGGVPIESAEGVPTESAGDVLMESTGDAPME